jgi:hypothetical protein
MTQASANDIGVSRYFCKQLAQCTDMLFDPERTGLWRLRAQA